MTVEIFHGSCLDLSASDLASFDVQISDFPYSPHVHENCASVGVAGGGLGAHARDLKFAALTPELRMQGAIAAACVARWSLIFTDLEGAHLWISDIEACGAEYVRWLPWCRWSQPQLSGDRPPTLAEILLFAHQQDVGPRGGKSPRAKHWNGPGNPLETLRRCLRSEDKHPTEKPLDLMLDLVSWLSDPGETIADLTAGRASTLQAARLLGRDSYGWEIAEDEARRGATRLRDPLSGRDHARASEWCETTFAEARAALDKPAAKDGSDRNTRERAERRIADVERVMGRL